MAGEWVVDLKGRRRVYMDVVLDDGCGTTVSVREPSRALVSRMDAFASEDPSGDGYLGELYGLVAAILSNNVEGVPVEQGQVDGLALSEAWKLVNTYRLYTAEQVAALAKN